MVSSLALGGKRPRKYDDIEGEDDFDGSAQRDLQALPTDFCDVCCKYFANPLTKVC